MTPELKSEAAAQVKLAAPPVVVNLAHTVGGLTLNEWVMVATLIYIGLQAGYLVWKWVKASKLKHWRPE